MDRGVKANAMWALHIVAPIGAMVGRATSQGAVTTGGVVKEVGWAEEEVKCEGGGIIGGCVEAEALRGRYTLYPRGGGTWHCTVKEATATDGRGGGTKKG
jgi:hypothetical protein